MLRRVFYFWLGLGILFANKMRYAVRGYRNPRPFRVTEVDKAVRHDMEVVAKWERVGVQWQGKSVLELGPGADLGPALLVLGKGASWYQALDANALIADAPAELYQRILDHLDPLGRSAAEQALGDFVSGRPSTLRYIHDAAFLFHHFADASIDLVVSNAAFEHFDDVPHVLKEVSRVVKPGGTLCIVVDLQTHTRVIRHRDPLNIYRYPSWLYRLAHFRGIPNRVLPEVYVDTLESEGWTDIRIVPDTKLSGDKLHRDLPGLAQEFRRPENDMGLLSFVLTAKR